MLGVSATFAQIVSGQPYVLNDGANSVSYGHAVDGMVGQNWCMREILLEGFSVSGGGIVTGGRERASERKPQN